MTVQIGEHALSICLYRLIIYVVTDRDVGHMVHLQSTEAQCQHNQRPCGKLQWMLLHNLSHNQAAQKSYTVSSVHIVRILTIKIELVHCGV